MYNGKSARDLYFLFILVSKSTFFLWE